MNKRETQKKYPDLTLLSAGDSSYPGSPEEAGLETFPNLYPQRDYWITFECPEFTSLCPVTNQPDFGRITIRYVANEHCLESKSLKLYLFSFRNYNIFHEEAVNRILDDLTAVCRPRRMVVDGHFNPRGGISLRVSCGYRPER